MLICSLYVYMVYFIHTKFPILPPTGLGWIKASEHIPATAFVVRNLQPDTGYIFLVRAQNSHGLSVPSPVTPLIRTKPGRLGKSRERLLLSWATRLTDHVLFYSTCQNFTRFSLLALINAVPSLSRTPKLHRGSCLPSI